MPESNLLVVVVVLVVILVKGVCVCMCGRVCVCAAVVCVVVCKESSFFVLFCFDICSFRAKGIWASSVF